MYWLSLTDADALQPAPDRRLLVQPPKVGLFERRATWERIHVTTLLPPGKDRCALVLTEPDPQKAQLWRSWTIGEPNQPVDALTLSTQEIDPPLMIVANILPAGLTILAGAPKCGKSWLILELALAVAHGRPWQGQDVIPGPVLYLALEDTYARLAQRIGEHPSENLHLHPHAAPNDIPALEDQIQRLTPIMVVIDTLGRWRDGVASTYARDTKLAASLKAIADVRGIALVAVHHTNKRPTADPMADVSGSRGLTGAADAVHVFRSDLALGVPRPQGMLFTSGRDVISRQLPFRWERNRWIASRAAGLIGQTQAKGAITYKPS